MHGTGWIMLKRFLIQLGCCWIQMITSLSQTAHTIAIFNAMRACLATLGKDYKKHSSVISDFRLNFLKPDKIDKTLSDIITALFYVRTQSDYNDHVRPNRVVLELLIDSRPSVLGCS